MKIKRYQLIINLYKKTFYDDFLQKREQKKVVGHVSFVEACSLAFYAFRDFLTAKETKVVAKKIIKKPTIVSMMLNSIFTKIHLLSLLGWVKHLFFMNFASWLEVIFIL